MDVFYVASHTVELTKMRWGIRFVTLGRVYAIPMNLERETMSFPALRQETSSDISLIQTCSKHQQRHYNYEGPPARHATNTLLIQQRDNKVTKKLRDYLFLLRIVTKRNKPKQQKTKRKCTIEDFPTQLPNYHAANNTKNYHSQHLKNLSDPTPFLPRTFFNCSLQSRSTNFSTFNADLSKTDSNSYCNYFPATTTYLSTNTFSFTINAYQSS